MSKVEPDVQTLTVPALSLNGLLVSRGIFFSRSSRTMVWSTTDLPLPSTVTKFNGMVLVMIGYIEKTKFQV